ncbi:hypothetical protein EVAR_40774_1 [Eumeta japonica]|uniref:Uncharacterized protein n=1 Tax=Eumeta variegata TaxID=151549 RepID=A0A4C1X2G6_EUMVA|nr:hypothetical protein EVAR_40774_1 [Eumeta japonica]
MGTRADGRPAVTQSCDAESVKCQNLVRNLRRGPAAAPRSRQNIGRRRNLLSKILITWQVIYESPPRGARVARRCARA